MDACTLERYIGHHHQRQVLIPVALMIRHILSQHVLQSTVHSFNHSITLWVVWRGSGLVYLEQQTHFLKQLGFEVSSLIWMDLFWRSISGNDFFHQLLCYGLCFLVWNSKRLFPFREIISDNQDVLVTGFSRWHWSHDVECNSFERITRTAAN